MYSIHDYGDMTADRRRTEAYAGALRTYINSESAVLDIGTGTGMLALLACQAGARKVYAVESDGVVQVAREVVAANGYTNRVEFFQAFSTEVQLPERVDLVVSDVHGVLPLFRGGPAALIDARRRLLKPAGHLIPARETLNVALAHAPAMFKRIVQPWERPFGLDVAAGRRRAVNEWRQCHLPVNALLTEPKTWTVLDYSTFEDVNVRGEVEWIIDHLCEAHGLCLWFDCETAPGFGFSNSPAAGDSGVYQQGFFPFPSTCALYPGTRVHVSIRADRIGEDYVWGWDTDVYTEPSAPVVQIKQTQFLGAPITADWMRRTQSGFVPRPNQEAAIDRLVLELFSTGRTLEEIARELVGRFPERFSSWRDALTRVGDLSMRYSA